MVFGEPARAQNARAPAELGEVIVTARKRQESILNVPVVETALPAATLQKFQVNDLRDMQKLVPGLGLGHSVLSIGTLVSMRGVGTPSTDPGVDQAVSLNIDGLQLTQGLAYSVGMFDMGQVEVLKGPQALFYGKASPGGVIAIRTADPTSTPEIIARASYEIESRERRGEFIISGPITDTVKGRLSALVSRSDGYFYNGGVAAPGSGGLTPNSRSPAGRAFYLRATLLWNPTPQFDARFKFNYAREKTLDAEIGQLVNCPNPGGANFAPPGLPMFNANDDCTLNRRYRNVFLDPTYFIGTQNNGVPFVKTVQKYGTLELNYRITPELTATSTTGIYDLASSSMVETGREIPPVFTSENGPFKRRDFTEEVRLNSDFTGPVNFTLGGFYQTGRLSDRVFLTGNAALHLPRRLSDGETAINVDAKSVFAQIRWKVIPQVELAAGARYTDEKRDQEVTNYLTGLRVPVKVDAIHTKNTAPEFTLTYRPTNDLTFFGAYKRAYKSGGFTAATVATPGSDNSFGDEKAKGWEIGLKSRLLDRRLLLNVAFYDYRYNGLQVGAIEQQQGGVPIIHTINAGAAKTYGVDFDATWRPEQIENLGLNFAVNWNHARYTTLNNLPCWSGQTISEGCNRNLNPATGRYTAQDVSGTPMIRAPTWQMNFGFDYEMPLGDNFKVTLSNSNQYSSKYVAFIAVNRPNNDNYIGAFFKSDVSLALHTNDDRWEIALIGKNITDKITAGLCSASYYSSGLILNTAGQITGGPTRGSSGMGEAACYADPGRAVYLRLTFRPLAGG
jgi:iron complex outermembrane receptor protein